MTLFMTGWFLSLDEEDAFLRRIPDLRRLCQGGELWDISSQFGTESNKNTIGILLVMLIIILVMFITLDLLHT